MNSSQYWKYVGIASAQLFAGSIVLPVLAPYFSSLGFTDSWISIVFGIFPFVMFVTSIFSGELSDELGRSWLIRAGLLATAVSYLLYFVGSGFSIVFARILDGVSYAALTVLLISKIQDLLSDESRGHFTGLFFSIKDGVRVLGPLIGGYLADRWIGAPFFTAIVMLVLAFFLLRGSSFHKKKSISLHPIKQLRWFLSEKKLRPFVILGPLMNGLLPASTVFLPLLVVNDLGLSYVAAGAASSAYMAGHILQFFFGDLSDSIGSAKVTLAGTLVMAVAVICTPLFANNYLSLLALYFVYGVGAAAWNVSAVKWLSTVGEGANKEGVVMGTYISIAKFGEGAAYVISSIVVAVFGYSGVFFVLGTLALCGVVAAGHLFVHLRRNQAIAG